MKRPESSILQSAQRIPTDVQPKAKKLTLAISGGDTTVVRRLSDKAQVVKLSFGTRNPGDARIRQTQVVA